jgi:hypothetical protein
MFLKILFWAFDFNISINDVYIKIKRSRFLHFLYDQKCSVMLYLLMMTAFYHSDINSVQKRRTANHAKFNTAKTKLFLSSEKNLLTFNCLPCIYFFLTLNRASISALIIYSLMF